MLFSLWSVLTVCEVLVICLNERYKTSLFTTVSNAGPLLRTYFPPTEDRSHQLQLKQHQAQGPHYTKT